MLQIREARWADADEVIDHLKWLHEESKEFGGIVRKGDRTDRWLSTMVGEAVRGYGLALVAMHRGKHVGSLVAAQTELPYDTDYRKVAAGVGTFVIPAARGMGVASKLYTAARRALIDRGFDGYLGAHLVKNARAQRVILRAGFEPFEVSVLMPLKEE